MVRTVERIGVKQSIQRAERRYVKRRGGFFLGLTVLLVLSGAVAVNSFSTNQKSEKSKEWKEPSLPLPEEVKEDEDFLGINDSSKADFSQEKKVVETIKKIEPKEKVDLPTKAFQYFTINTSKDTTIVGVEGTKISFKANTLDAPKNRLVQIGVKEHYKMSAIAFSNLTTETSDGKLLETGGMVYLDAKLDNQPIGLKKGAQVELKFPFDEKKEDMVLFEGKEVDSTIVWDRAKIDVDEGVEVFEEEVFTIVESMPEFPGGQRALFRHLSVNLKYPEALKSKGINGKVYVNFTVDKNGEIRDIQILRGVHPLLDREAIRVVANMPNWKPGRQRGKAVSVSYNLPINFRGENVDFMDTTSKDWTDSLVAEERKEIAETIGDTLSNRKVQLIQAVDINYHLLASSRLGWINCDRFTYSNTKRITFQIATKGKVNSNVKLIFHRVKGIMAGNRRLGICRFYNMSVGEKVSVFAIKYLKNRLFVCLQDLRVSKEKVELEFEELTKEKLEEYQNKIDAIH